MNFFRTQRPAVIKKEEESGTAGIEGETPFRSVMERSGNCPGNATNSRKRGVGLAVHWMGINQHN